MSENKLIWSLETVTDLTSWAIPFYFGWMKGGVYRCFMVRFLCFGIALVRGYEKSTAKITH